MRVYIAYSIAGSEVYIVAWRYIMNPEILSSEFTFFEPRRKQARVCGDVRPFLVNESRFESVEGRRVNWRMLYNKNGRPLKSPAILLNRLKILEKEGWTVCRQALLQKFYPKSVILKPRRIW